MVEFHILVWAFFNFTFNKIQVMYYDVYYKTHQITPNLELLITLEYSFLLRLIVLRISKTLKFWLWFFKLRLLFNLHFLKSMSKFIFHNSIHANKDEPNIFFSLFLFLFLSEVFFLFLSFLFYFRVLVLWTSFLCNKIFFTIQSPRVISCLFNAQ